jgi:membrane-associated HD superfamily phosphohydrolase
MEELALFTDQTVEEVVIPKKRKKKATPVKDRTIADLHTVGTKSMTDKEMRNYINALRDDVAYYQMLCEQYKDNAESAYAKVQELERQHNQFKTQALAVQHFVRQAISTCNSSVLLATKLEG